MPSPLTKCSTHNCSTLLRGRNISGKCRECIGQANRAAMHPCDRCGTLLRKSVKGSFCRPCMKQIAVNKRSDCRTCGEPLFAENRSGFCFVHLKEHRAKLRAEKLAAAPSEPIVHKPYAVRQLIEAASFITRTSVADICGKDRFAYLVRIRSAIIYLARPHYSTIQIGRFMGGRDHSTIINAHSKALRLLENKGFKLLIDGIERETLRRASSVRAAMAAELQGLAA